MKKQVFDQQGNLVEEIEIDVIPSPNIAGFMAQMILNQNYQQIAAISSSTIISRLELVVARIELKSDGITLADLQLLKSIWDGIIMGTPSDILLKISAEEINQLAIANYMPFRFGDDFYLVIIDN